MLDLQYSKVVQQKLMELRAYLVQISGEKRGTKTVAELYDYREDYANQFFHVRTTNDEEDRFWGE